MDIIFFPVFQRSEEECLVLKIGKRVFGSSVNYCFWLIKVTVFMNIQYLTMQVNIFVVGNVICQGPKTPSQGVT